MPPLPCAYIPVLIPPCLSQSRCFQKHWASKKNVFYIDTVDTVLKQYFNSRPPNLHTEKEMYDLLQSSGRWLYIYIAMYYIITQRSDAFAASEDWCPCSKIMREPPRSCEYLQDPEPVSTESQIPPGFQNLGWVLERKVAAACYSPHRSKPPKPIPVKILMWGPWISRQLLAELPRDSAPRLDGRAQILDLRGNNIFMMYMIIYTHIYCKWECI